MLMQAYHCIFAIGTFVSPWVAAPFILPDQTNGSFTRGKLPLKICTRRDSPCFFYFCIWCKNQGEIAKDKNQRDPEPLPPFRSDHWDKSVKGILNPCMAVFFVIIRRHSQKALSWPQCCLLENEYYPFFIYFMYFIPFSSAGVIYSWNSTQDNVSEFGPNVTLETTQQTRVHFSYLIIGCYVLVSSMLFSITYLVWVKFEELDKPRRKQKTTNNNGYIGPRDFEPMWYRAPMMTAMFLRFATLVGIEVAFASFLMTFAVKGLNWSKADGIAVTSSFRACFAAARGLGVVFAVFVSPTKMVLKDMAILVASFAVLTFFVESHDLVLWIGSGAVGFGIGSMYGSSLSWADRQMIVTAKAGSTFVTGTWIGVLVVPACIGYLFDNFGPLWFIYSCSVSTLLIVPAVALAMLFAWCYHKRRRPAPRERATKL